MRRFTMFALVGSLVCGLAMAFGGQAAFAQQKKVVVGKGQGKMGQQGPGTQQQKYAATNLGIYLNNVVPGSAAAQAGLEVGDIITSINGVQMSSMQHLVNALQTGTATMQVINCRDGSTITVTAYPQAGKLGVQGEVVEISMGDQGGGTIYGGTGGVKGKKK